MNRVTRDTETVQRFIQGQSTAIINESLLVLGVAIVLFASNWRLALMVIVPMPLVLFAVQRMREWIRLIFRHQWRMYDKANSTLQDILSGIRVVKAFGQESREVARFKSASRELAAVTEKNEKTWSTLFPTMGSYWPWAVPCPLLRRTSGIARKASSDRWYSYPIAGMLYGPPLMSFIPLVCRSHDLD